MEDQVADRPHRTGKAMTRNIGDLEKTRLRTSESVFFGALRKKLALPCLESSRSGTTSNSSGPLPLAGFEMTPVGRF